MHSVQIASLLRLRSPHIASTTGAGRGQFAQIQNQNALLCFVQLYIFDLLILHPIYMHRVLTACDFFDLIFFDCNWDHQHHVERIIPGWRSHSLALHSCDHHPINGLLCILQDLTSGSSRYIKKKKYDGCISFKCLVFLRF